MAHSPRLYSYVQCQCFTVAGGRKGDGVRRAGWSCGKRRSGKQFFFEKKNQKTFAF
jgi:hypothetical protein